MGGRAHIIIQLENRPESKRAFFHRVLLFSLRATCVKITEPWLCDCRNRITRILSDLGYAFQFFLRIRPSLHSHGTHEHSEHVAGMEK
jgi:hypothetical protein